MIFSFSKRLSPIETDRLIGEKKDTIILISYVTGFTNSN